MDVRTYELAKKNASGGGGGSVPQDIERRITSLEYSVRGIKFDFNEDFSNDEYIDTHSTSAIKGDNGYTVKAYMSSYVDKLNAVNRFKLSEFNSVNSIIDGDGKLTATDRVATYMSKKIDISNVASVGLVVSESHSEFIGAKNEAQVNPVDANIDFLKFNDPYGGKWLVWARCSNNTSSIMYVYAERRYKDSQGVENVLKYSKSVSILVSSSYISNGLSVNNRPKPTHYIDGCLGFDVCEDSKVVGISLSKGSLCSFSVQNYSNTTSNHQTYTTACESIMILLDYSGDTITEKKEVRRNNNDHSGAYSRASSTYYGKAHVLSNNRLTISNDFYITTMFGHGFYSRLSNNPTHAAIYNHITHQYNVMHNILHYQKDGIDSTLEFQTAFMAGRPYLGIKKLSDNDIARAFIVASDTIRVSLATVNTLVDGSKTVTQKDFDIKTNVNPQTGENIEEYMLSKSIPKDYLPDEYRYDGINKVVFNGDHLYIISVINRGDRASTRIVVSKYGVIFNNGEIKFTFDEKKDLATYSIGDNFTLMNECRFNSDTHNQEGTVNLNTQSSECMVRNNNIIFTKDELKLFFIVSDIGNAGKHTVVQKSIALDLSYHSDEYIVHQSGYTGSYVYSSVRARVDEGVTHVDVCYSPNVTSKLDANGRVDVSVEKVSSTTKWRYKLDSNPDTWVNFSSGVKLDNLNEDYITLRCDFKSDNIGHYSKVSYVNLDVVNSEDTVITNSVVSSGIPNVAKAGTGILTSSSMPNDGSIDWKVSYNGGRTWNDIAIGQEFEYNLNYSPDFRVRGDMTFDRSIVGDAPIINNYALLISSISPHSESDKNLINLMKTNIKLDRVLGSDANKLHNVYIEPFSNTRGVDVQASEFEYDEEYKTVGGNFVVTRTVDVPPKSNSFIVSSLEERTSDQDVFEYFISLDDGANYMSVPLLDTVFRLEGKSLGKLKLKVAFRNNARLKALSCAWV